MLINTVNLDSFPFDEIAEKYNNLASLPYMIMEVMRRELKVNEFTYNDYVHIKSILVIYTKIEVIPEDIMMNVGHSSNSLNFYWNQIKGGSGVILECHTSGEFLLTYRKINNSWPLNTDNYSTNGIWKY